MYLCQEVWVANDNKKCFSSADGYVESLWVGEEAKMVEDIGINHTSCRTNLREQNISAQPYDETLCKFKLAQRHDIVLFM